MKETKNVYNAPRVGNYPKTMKRFPVKKSVNK